MINKNLKYVLILLVLSYVCFMLGNSMVSLTNPDEVFYTQTAKEMAKYNTWMTPYLFDAPQFEKPIFLYWFLRASLIIFPNPNFAARFSTALFGMIGVIAVYYLALLGFKNEKKAFVSALVLMSCGLYIGLARTVFTDMIFTVLILISLLFFYWGYTCQGRKGPGILLFFVFAGLAVLAKGPLGFLIPFLTIAAFLIIKKDIRFLFCKYSLWGILAFIGVSFPWYALMIKKYGSTFTYEFFYNDHIRRLIEAEHISNDTWYFYPFSMIGCIFPWSLYTFVSLIFLFKYLKKGVNHFYIFLALWLGVTFLIFQPAHSKLVSYIFPLFPALAIITGDFIYNSSLPENKSRVFFVISLVMGAILFLMAIALFTQIPRNSTYLPSKTPAYLLFAILVFLTALFCFFIFRHKFLKASFVLVVLMCSLSLLMLFILKEVETYVSSKESSEYLLKNYTVSGPIVSSKPFARGVRYYTEKEIVVLDLPGKNYFSPHPVTFLYNDEKVKEYLRAQNQPVYCILKKANVEDIERVADKEFKFTVLNKIGNEYILRIEPNKKK
ncbi:MAG: glycosyltransferase family 39 protein [Candidatus Omnitrophica bacterium]|nr:glycosyltransferase family 39 protein [Candidatus Omnitrophota bacterium]